MYNNVEISPIIAKARAMMKPLVDPATDKRWTMEKDKPNLYKFLKGWTNSLAKTTLFTILPRLKPAGAYLPTR